MTPSEAIERLRAAGMTEKAIGLSVGAGQSTINRIRRAEMQPTWAVGAALVRLAEGLPPGSGEADDSEQAEAA